MKIVILNECFLSEKQIGEMKDAHEVTAFEITSSIIDAKERIKDAEVIFVDQFICPLGKEVLDSAKHLKLIILNTTSCHLLDLEYLKARDIAVCNTPEYCSDSVAELAFMYILSLMRKVNIAYKDNIDTPFEIFPDDVGHRKYVGQNLNQKTIGVIGLGKIGQKVCSIAQGFNMKVLGYNRSQKNILGVVNTGLEQLLKNSDIIVFTVPYNDDSHMLLNSCNLDILKKGAILVNLSSQEIVDEEALIQKLQVGEVAGYALDNYTNKDKTHYFYNNENVFILPHIGFFTQESLDMIGTRMMEGYRGYIANQNINRII